MMMGSHLGDRAPACANDNQMAVVSLLMRWQAWSGRDARKLSLEIALLSRSIARAAVKRRRKARIDLCCERWLSQIELALVFPQQRASRADAAARQLTIGRPFVGGSTRQPATMLWDVPGQHASRR